MRNKLLNGLTPAQFLHKHWQKKPLLARDSLPEFADFRLRCGQLELKFG